jgi:hypothetical protein
LEYGWAASLAITPGEMASGAFIASDFVVQRHALWLLPKRIVELHEKPRCCHCDARKLPHGYGRPMALAP